MCIWPKQQWPVQRHSDGDRFVMSRLVEFGLWPPPFGWQELTTTQKARARLYPFLGRPLCCRTASPTVCMNGGTSLACIQLQDDILESLLLNSNVSTQYNLRLGPVFVRNFMFNLIHQHVVINGTLLIIAFLKDIRLMRSSETLNIGSKGEK